jgi:hypothetical protein
MEKQKKDIDNEKFKDTDQGFNARNQYSGSGDFSPDEQEDADEKSDDIESSANTEQVPPKVYTDLEQDESGTLKSNN